MVRVNIIEPWALADQHLHAEYNELLMLAGYVLKNPESKSTIPPTYRLGAGHILFFRDKLAYVHHRHELLRTEMRDRGFRADVSFPFEELPPDLMGTWIPARTDVEIIKERISTKLALKPTYYRYRRQPCPLDLHLSRLSRAGPA